MNLSEFIQQKREQIGLSTIGLAKKSNIALEVLEDIESGKELFLSVTQRQQLARVLKCSPKEIKQYERNYEYEIVNTDEIDKIKQDILNKKCNLKCPICGEPLVTRIAKSYDLEDNLILTPKAHCIKCVFQIKD